MVRCFGPGTPALGAQGIILEIKYNPRNIVLLQINVIRGVPFGLLVEVIDVVQQQRQHLFNGSQASGIYSDWVAGRLVFTLPLGEISIRHR